MRKLVALLLSLLCCVWALSVPAQAAPAVRVFLDGAQVAFDVDPVLENGRTLVPVRALSEALGFTVSWDAAEQLVSLTRDGTTIVLWIDSTKVLVGEKESHLEVPARILNGRTMVPLRFISETLGSYVTWDNEAYAASIISDKALRGMLLKSLQNPTVDQKAHGDFQTKITLRGDGVPASGITISSDLVYTSHIYKNQLYMKATAQMPFAPATVTELAALGGTIYTKESGTSGWTKAGTYDPADIGGAAAFTGVQGLTSADFAAEVLGAARISRVAAAQADGASVLQVTVDLSGAKLEQLLQQVLAGQPTPGANAGTMAKVERFLVTYVLHPETGFIYQTNIDLLLALAMGDTAGSGEMTIAVTGSTEARPTAEPIKFPSELTK